jgi:hypothetical protein
MTAHDPQVPDEARFIREWLDALERERMRLESRLRQIEQGRNATKPTPMPEPTVTNTSPAADKIALFRSLFAGRIDVFPTRWENPKSGRSGYAPACANEWVRGVCGKLRGRGDRKPRVRCGECPNQAFIPVTDGTIKCSPTSARLQPPRRLARLWSLLAQPVSSRASARQHAPKNPNQTERLQPR